VAEVLVIDVDWVMNQVARLDIVKTSLENDLKEQWYYEGALGSGDVAHAMAEVTRDWGQQKQAIIKQLDGLITTTRGAAETFHEQDQGGARAFGPGNAR
jgi:hypothetical protein